MAKTWFWQVAYPVAFCCCLASWSAAAASVESPSSAARQVVLHARQPLQDARVLVRWQRVPQRQGGQYLLYRGTDRDSLTRVATLAVDGSESFEVQDPTIGEGRRLYQLRYLDRHGREHVLTTVLLELSHIEEQMKLELMTGAYQPLESSPTWSRHYLDFYHRLPLVEARAPMGGVSAPPSPPPRRVIGNLERTHAYA